MSISVEMYPKQSRKSAIVYMRISFVHNYIVATVVVFRCGSQNMLAMHSAELLRKLFSHRATFAIVICGTCRLKIEIGIYYENKVKFDDDGVFWVQNTFFYVIS